MLQPHMPTTLFHSIAPLGADPRQWKICVVLPTRNEEATLAGVIGEIRAAFAQHGLRDPVIVISDDSHDRTRQIAGELGVRVVNGEGKGLGFAMQKALKAALRLAPDVLVTMDADGQSDPREIMSFLEPIAKGEADLVLGSRFLKPGLVQYRYRFINRAGTRILAWMMRKITGLPLTDSHGGLRAWRTEVVRHLEIMGTHTYVQETIIDAWQKGFRIREIPSAWRKREKGKSRVVGSIPKYIMYTLPILLIRSGTHVRWLYRASALLVGAGIMYFIVILAESGFSKARLYGRIPALIAVSMLAVIGIQLFTLGFITEILRMIKLRVDHIGEESGTEES
jgi:glycosyltransferase involved in cell wall biosynthesis